MVEMSKNETTESGSNPAGVATVTAGNSEEIPATTERRSVGIAAELPNGAAAVEVINRHRLTFERYVGAGDAEICAHCGAQIEPLRGIFTREGRAVHTGCIGPMVDAAIAAEAAAPVEEAPKRKRGRPRKTPPVDQQPVAGAPAVPEVAEPMAAGFGGRDLVRVPGPGPGGRWVERGPICPGSWTVPFGAERFFPEGGAVRRCEREPHHGGDHGALCSTCGSNVARPDLFPFCSVECRGDEGASTEDLKAAQPMCGNCGTLVQPGESCAFCTRKDPGPVALFSACVETDRGFFGWREQEEHGPFPTAACVVGALWNQAAHEVTCFCGTVGVNAYVDDAGERGVIAWLKEHCRMWHAEPLVLPRADAEPGPYPESNDPHEAAWHVPLPDRVLDDVIGVVRRYESEFDRMGGSVVVIEAKAAADRAICELFAVFSPLAAAARKAGR